MTDSANVPPDELAALLERARKTNERIDAALQSLKTTPLPKLVKLYRELAALQRELGRALGEPVD